jgi:hypothetical protein
MIGYLGDPERTEQACHAGYYVTGDLAFVDDVSPGRIFRSDSLGLLILPQAKPVFRIKPGDHVITTIDSGGTDSKGRGHRSRR